MTLWAIMRSPLFMGGDLTRLDDQTLALLTNPEVLAVNQGSDGNRQLFRRGDHVAWIADAPGKQGQYLALFNLSDESPAEIVVNPAELGHHGHAASVPLHVRDLWSRQDLGTVGVVRLAVPSHGTRLVRIA